MTVASSTDRATFPGNGVTQIFPLPFRFFANSEIQAWLVTNATGALTALTLGTHYTLSGAGDPEVDGNPTSELTMLTAPTSLQSLFVLRVIPLTQPTDIVNQGKFFPEIHENVFDRLTMLTQQANGESKGAIRVAIGDSEPARLAPAVSRANQLMGFDSQGNPIAVAPVSGDAADLALSLANDTDPAKGAGQIGYLPGGLGAVGRTILEKMRESVSVHDFGAVGDGVADDTAAIQAAIDAFGGVRRITGAGTFRITASLTYHTSGSVAGLWLDLDPGTVIVADFAGNVISFPEGEPVISLNGAGTLFAFQLKGYFSAFTITMSGTASNIAGIQTVGAWDYILDGTTIEDIDGNGIYLPNRTDLDPNPDAWASVKWSLNKCRIINCLDGIQSQAGQGSAGWQLYDCYVINNKRNGVLADGSAWRYVGGAYAFNGKAGAGSGIKYVKHLGVTPSNAYIDQCEIDSNWTAGFEADEFGLLEINRGRFISKFNTVHPGHTAQQSHIKITTAIAGAKLTHNFHRMDSGLTAPITLYDFGTPIGNRASILVDDYRVQNDFGATVVEATTGALASRFGNVVRKVGSAGGKNNDYRNFVYAAKATLAAVPSVATKWIFATSQSPTGWTGSYNAGTGDLTAPFAGDLEVLGHLTIDDMSAGARFRIQVFVNAASQDAFYFQPAAATVRHTLQFSTTISVIAGDIVSVQIDATGTGTNVLTQPGHLRIRAL